MTPTEALPLLVVVVLMASAGGADPQSMTVVYEGDRTLAATTDVHVVAGGTTTVPAGTTVTGDLYVLDGTLRVAGTVDGDVTVLGGRLAAGADAAVTGTLATYGGTTEVATAATVGDRTSVTTGGSAALLAGPVGTAIQATVLGAVGFILVRRRPHPPANVARAATDHPVVSGAVGLLAGVTLLVLGVYMAVTLVLLPVTVLVLLGLLLAVLYGQVGLGTAIGHRLPVDDTAPATALGTAATVVGLDVVTLVPVLGIIVQLAVTAVGLGAVLATYLGLRPYEPPAIPG